MVSCYMAPVPAANDLSPNRSPDLSFRARFGQAVAKRCINLLYATRHRGYHDHRNDRPFLNKGCTMFFADFDWGQVGRSALIGGAIGAVVGLVAWLARRNKSKDDDDKRA